MRVTGHGIASYDVHTVHLEERGITYKVTITVYDSGDDKRLALDSCRATGSTWAVGWGAKLRARLGDAAMAAVKEKIGE